MVTRAAVLLGCSLSAITFTAAHAAGRPVANPPILTPRTTVPDKSMILPLGVNQSQPTEPYLDLHIMMVDGKLYNPAADRDEPVRLRSYQGTGVNPATPFISPMIETRPGQTVRIRLDNQLAAEPGCADGSSINTPHCFNNTNLHSHGLWVNPAGNS
ncbi:MAG: hypothetical protein RL367_690, partial [Pseudomonadota bacterium]